LFAFLVIGKHRNSYCHKYFLRDNADLTRLIRRQKIKVPPCRRLKDGCSSRSFENATNSHQQVPISTSTTNLHWSQGSDQIRSVELSSTGRYRTPLDQLESAAENNNTKVVVQQNSLSLRFDSLEETKLSNRTILHQYQSQHHVNTSLPPVIGLKDCTKPMEPEFLLRSEEIDVTGKNDFVYFINNLLKQESMKKLPPSSLEVLNHVRLHQSHQANDISFSNGTLQTIHDPIVQSQSTIRPLNDIHDAATSSSPYYIQNPTIGRLLLENSRFTKIVVSRRVSTQYQPVDFEPRCIFPDNHQSNFLAS
jgi:hypothetical protein